jgi:hypothetical protein
LPVEIDPSIIALEKEFDGLAAAVAALKVSIVNNTPGPPTGPTGNGGVGDTPPKFGGSGEDIGPQSVGGGGTTVFNFYLNGTFVDMQEFKGNIIDAVALAQRETPTKFAPTY